jgi:hypothetical protein
MHWAYLRALSCGRALELGAAALSPDEPHALNASIATARATTIGRILMPAVNGRRRFRAVVELANGEETEVR